MKRCWNRRLYVEGNDFEKFFLLAYWTCAIFVYRICSVFIVYAGFYMSVVARTIVPSTVKVYSARSCIMTIPHSSTVCERVLSTVRKNSLTRGHLRNGTPWRLFLGWRPSQAVSWMEMGSTLILPWETEECLLHIPEAVILLYVLHSGRVGLSLFLFIIFRWDRFVIYIYIFFFRVLACGLYRDERKRTSIDNAPVTKSKFWTFYVKTPPMAVKANSKIFMSFICGEKVWTLFDSSHWRSGMYKIGLWATARF